MKKTQTGLIREFFTSPFNLLNTKYRKLFLVFFTGIFGSAFLWLFNPFNITSWVFSVTPFSKMGFVLFGLLGMAVLTFSQFGLRSWFRLEQLNWGSFAVIAAFEFALLNCINFVLFGTPGPDEGWFRELFSVIRQTSLVLGLSYSIALLLLSLWSVKEKNREFKAQLNKSQRIVQEYINIKDESGKTVLSVIPDNLLLFKSESNYITVYFLVENKVTKTLIRSSLKKMEKEIENTEFIRIHRSYMINTRQVTSIHPTKKAYSVTMNALPEISVPVSVSYKIHFEKKLKITEVEDQL